MNGSSRVAVVMVAFGAEPTLAECLTALVASDGVDLDAIVVDNGADPEVMELAAGVPGVRVLGPPRNRGFTGGCNTGAAASDAATIVLLNTDAFVAPDAIAALARVVWEPGVGIASASLRLDDAPEMLNSAGNPVHYSGLTWSGAFGESAEAHAGVRDIASATGAAMAIRRTVWDRLGGFDESMFAYLEDTELSLRCWQLGSAVRYVPEAVVRHRYEFGRHERKFFLLERNRGYMLLTLFELRTLVLLAPALLLVEVAMFAQAVAGGWGRAKLRAWIWLVRHHSDIRRRRTVVRSSKMVGDRELAAHLSSRIDPANVAQPPGMSILNAALGAYWRLVRGALAPDAPAASGRVTSAGSP